MDVRSIPDEMAFALVKANNEAQLAAVSTTYPHVRKFTISGADYRNPSETLVQVTAANATNEDTSVTLVNQIKAVLNRHFADEVAHDDGVSSAVATADATNTATASTLANAIKTALNTHAADTDVHFNADATNTVTNANATDQATLNTLVNEIKGDVNGHVAAAPPGVYLHLVPA